MKGTRLMMLATLCFLGWPCTSAFAQEHLQAPLVQWIFANIRLTVMGPNTVKIEWIPLRGADQYRVYRNGIEIGPAYPSAATATQPITVYDYTAPANATLSYRVDAAHRTVVQGLPGTPGAGQTVAVETLLQASNTVTVVTPAQPRSLNEYAGFIQGLALQRKLSGFVDLHTHPLSYLGFGGKLIFGGVDNMAPLPPTVTLIGTPCWLPPSSEMTAMGPPYENIVYGPFDPLINPCGDSERATVIPAFELFLGSAVYLPPSFLASGPPTFITWPAWNDVLRQKMWVDWIQRAYAGGLRVMVALAVNNPLLGRMTAGPKDLPTDDLASADKQIDEIKNFVQRHDFMRLVMNSAELYSAVTANKLAVVVGVEIDHIGNLVGDVSAPLINMEIDRLYGKGVRYIFPVHLVDNPIGASAAYNDLFNVANVFENSGAGMNLGCEADIGYSYSPPSPALTVAAFTKLGTATPSIPPAVPCLPGYGNVNIGSPNGFVGLTPAGKVAIQHMMDLGMLIDVDHMSELAVTDTILLAKQNMPVAYPLMSGHNGLRYVGGNCERQLNAWQYGQIGLLHGMAGIGSAKQDAVAWLNAYQKTLAAMVPANTSAGAFGTDADGMEFMMPPRSGSSVNSAVPPPQLPQGLIPSLPPAKDGFKTWDYNHDGVAHYGLLPDFLEDVATLPGGAAAVVRMFGGAQYFYETWYLAERDKR